MQVKNNPPLKVLMFYDLKGWAWWHRINNIAKNQPDDIIIDSLPTNADFDHQLYDFILVFDSFLLKIILKVPPDKLIIGCSCPKIMEQFLNALLLFKPLAGLVNSQEMYNSTKDYYKIFYCPNGVDERLFTPGINKGNSLTACWVGNSKHFAGKGLDIIRQVCNKVRIPLITYDRSDNKDGLIMSQVELREKVYCKSDFYICYSEYEGTPNPALEALSCGLPVITTKVGNMPEIIVDGENGFLLERNENSLVEAIEELKKSSIKEMSVNARNSILNGWTWKTQAENYTNMFRLLKSNYSETKIIREKMDAQSRDFQLIESKEGNDMINMKEYKQRIADVTFVFLVRLDNIDRLENILASTKFISTNFETNILVSEYSSFNNGLLKKLLENNIKYSYQEDHDPILFRTKFINQMVRTVETPFVAVWDADVIISVRQISMAIQLLRNGSADFVYPYEKYAYDTSAILRRLYLEENKIEVLEQNVKKMKEMYPPNPLGGAFLVNRISYLESGLENENFYGWGLEDGERFYRWENMGYRIKRVPGPLFHLTHVRGLNSNFQNGDQQKVKRKEILGEKRKKDFQKIHTVNK
jgi:glycosyltransferase involved in cell wall biosynthesis